MSSSQQVLERQERFVNDIEDDKEYNIQYYLSKKDSDPH
jgi:hypothetical protein